jgi:CubicO group peptidase (beta-lactamase class C family)
MRPTIALTLLAACGGSPRKTTAPAPTERPPAVTSLDAGAAVRAPLFADPETIGPKTFYVVGPFPSVLGRDANEAKRRPGLDFDYLAALGGEAVARLKSGTTVSFKTKPFAAQEAKLDDRWALDFAGMFGEDTDQKTAYAYAEWPAAKAVTALALFGSDDGAVVWLNGHQVHRVATNRALDPSADRFEVPLDAGSNRLLVKVDNQHGGWGFALRVLDDEGQARLEALDARRHLERFGPAPRSGSYLLDGSFPALDWAPTAAAELAVQPASMRVRWYGPDFAEARRPEARGQYTAVVEARTLDGFTYRRMRTFAKVPDRVSPRFRAPPLAEMPLLDVAGNVDMSLNDAQRAELSRYFWRGASEALSRGEDSAIASLAFMKLGESPPAKTEPLWLWSGFIQAAEHRLHLRMQLEGRSPKTLYPPARLTPPAPELRAGSELQAGFRAGTVEKLRAIARAWAKEDPHPFVILVTRRGVVMMHEGYNGFGKDSLFWPASITKTIAGLAFSRAVQQALVDFDQPVATLLSDWKDERTTGVTFRHCFYHVTGLSGHASHEGMFNTYLDNALFTEDAVFARPMARYVYNGDDINLTGKALELLTGQSIWRLLYEQMEAPFGEPVSQLDLGCCGSFTAMYLAKVGQMILQDGRYGPFEFFKPGFLEALRPKRIADFAPDVEDKKKEAGIGIEWMADPPGPREKGALGPEVIGHGAASGTAWRVDGAHQLVVVIGRDGYRDWHANEEWTTKFVKSLAESLVN